MNYICLNLFGNNVSFLNISNVSSMWCTGRIAAGSVIPHTGDTRAMTDKSALRTEQAKEEN